MGNLKLQQLSMNNYISFQEKARFNLLVFTPVVKRPTVGFTFVGLLVFLSKITPELRALPLLTRSFHLMKYLDKYSQPADEKSWGSSKHCEQELLLLCPAKPECSLVPSPSAENKRSSLSSFSPAICN